MDYVKKAQNDWQEPVNKIVDAVNGLMAGVEPTHLDNPVEYLNGTTGAGTQAWVWQKGSVKLVVIALALFKLAKDQSGQVIMRLPDNLKPVTEFQVPVNQDGLITNGYTTDGPNTDIYYFNFTGSNVPTEQGDRRATLIYLA